MSVRLFYLLFVIVLISCESPVNGDLGLNDYTPQTVVNAAISAQLPPSVQVTKSKGILDGSPYEYDDGAIVEIRQGGQVFRLEHAQFGTYTTDQLLQAGVACELEVTTSQGVITASDEVPELVPILEVSMQDSVSLLGLNVPVAQVRLTFDDPPGEVNHYQVLLYQRGDGDTIEIAPFKTRNVNVVNRSSSALGDIDGFQDNALISDDLVNGETFTLEMLTLTVYDDRPVYVSLKSLSQTYFDYLLNSDLANEAFDNPFSEPVTMETNIEGGLGIMVGYALALDSVRAE